MDFLGLGLFWETSEPVMEEPKPLNEAWRNINWGDREKELKWLNSFSLEEGTKKHLRILLYGPSGSGKSSFINSVDSVCQNRITSPAAASSSDGTFTVTYKTHQIQKGKAGQYYPFVFNDVMGLEDNKGVCKEDIQRAMQGHLKEGHKFDAAPALCPSDGCYNKNPDRNDMVDILVCVLSANTLHLMEHDTVNKINVITTAARDYEIPQMAILTNIDEACPLVKESVQNVYKSERIRKRMNILHTKLGIPLTNVFPVKNYHEEQDLNGDIDMLILRALRQIIHIANDRLNKSTKGVE